MDGLGVNNSGSYEWDEIEGIELLHLHFEVSRILNDILITDFFNEPYEYGSGTFLEIGYYSFNNTDWIEFSAPESNLPSPITNGELLLSFSLAEPITDIWFKGPGLQNFHEDYGDFLENHEFSVAWINVIHTPGPATILLLASGLAGIAGFRKRYKP
jgi:hypothetical protein